MSSSWGTTEMCPQLQTPHHPRRDRRPTYKVVASAAEKTSTPRKSKMGKKEVLRYTPGPRGESWLHRTVRVHPRRKMMEVVVPTLRQIQDRQKATAIFGGRDASRETGVTNVKEEENIKPYPFLNAEVKLETKSEEATSDDLVHNRLLLIGYQTLDIKLPQSILGATTTRDFLSKVWGGNTKATFPKIGKAYTHGLDDFMYLNLAFNPHGPHWPGAPGLLLGFKDDGDEWHKIQRVIVRLRSGVWHYVGQYKMTRAPPLTPDEWRGQLRDTKRNLATRLSQSKEDMDVKARIVLWQRLQREPTAEELERAIHSGEKFESTREEIIQACDEGRVITRVWCMKCVDYDADFQRRIASAKNSQTRLCKGN